VISAVAALAVLAALVVAATTLAHAAMATTAQARAADPGEVTWTRYWDSDDEDGLYLVAPCANGDVIAAGYTESPTFQHIVVVRQTPGGGRRWSKVIGVTSAFWDTPVALAVDRGGNCFLAGMRRETGGDNDILVVKLRSTGKVAWTRQMDGGVSAADLAADVATDADGGAYVACRTESAAGATGLILRLRARNGATAWRREFTGEHTLVSPTSITADARGTTCVTGGGTVGALGEMVTVSLSPAGRVRWTAEEPGLGGDHSTGLHVALAPGGALYVAGAAGVTADDSDIVLARYTTAGVRRWRDELNVSESAAWREVPSGLAVDRYGNAFVAGYCDTGVVSPDHGFVARWRPGGGRWYWDPPVSSDTDTGLSAVVADEAGGCYVAGRIIANYHDVGKEIEVGYFARFRSGGSHAWERANAFVGGRTSFDGMAAWPGRGICLVGDTRDPDGAERRGLVQLRRR
jgi:hypothetical protein